jgi:hypothetical protein
MYLDTETLQIFNGTLTEITCSIAMSLGVPVFRVMEQGLAMVYTYDQLPDLFGIEANISQTGNNVTLYINGTNHSNNVTIMCGYYNTDLFSGQSLFQDIFTLTLEFASKFITQI